ncbi:MAG: rod shape-determining protein MreC [Ruminococcaceae bacterium]|nr:rod shape-determining protein MreC [Oscillospiraceae bacterium]
MKNLFQNKFMIVLIVISILLVGTTSFISALGYTSYVRNAIGIVLTPIQKGANYVFDSIENIFSDKNDYKKLKEENENLKLMLAEKESELANAELTLKENENLKDFLGLKEEHPDFVFADAKITGRQSNSYSIVYTLDKGTYHGIEPGMPVVDKYGVIGCISEVGLTWSKATSVTEPDFSVGVIVERTGEVGISSGTFSASKDGLCVVSYLPVDTDIKAGDRIITSGNNSIYPKGLLLGTVESIKADPVSREIQALVKPAANLTETSSVMIITDYGIIYE